ncbi:MAG TPA: CHAP domain-containing protein [Candidatus Saccharimonadales bacterium]
MKWSTTPVSKRARAIRALLFIGVASALIMSPFTAIPPAKADEFDDQIRSLNREIDGYQDQAQELSKKANTLQSQLSKLNNEKAALQKRIDLNEVKHKKLTAQIKDTEQKIEDNKNALGETLVDLSIEGDRSALEMLASSSNVSDFVEKQAYQKNLRDNLGEKIKEIETLKKKLEESKKDVEAVLEDQKGQRKILAQKEAERQTLLDKTKGSERAYRNLINSREDKVQELRAEQAAVAAALAGGGSGATGGSASNVSGYPLYPRQCGPGNDGYGYWPCQCVSYVAYRLAGDGLAKERFSGLGDASSWWNAGTTVSKNNIRRGDVIVWITGPYGHVMYVESVSGGTIYFTDFNGMGGPESPGSGTVSTTDATRYPMKVIRL